MTSRQKDVLALFVHLVLPYSWKIKVLHEAVFSLTLILFSFSLELSVCLKGEDC